VRFNPEISSRKEVVQLFLPTAFLFFSVGILSIDNALRPIKLARYLISSKL